MSPQVTFSDWAGGEFGELGPTGAKDNQWTGRNVMVYKNGSLGPRPGVKALNTNTNTGVVWGLRGIGSPSSGTSLIVFGQGAVVKDFTLGFTGSQGTVQQLGTVSMTITVTTQIVQTGPGNAVIPSYGDQTYYASTNVVPLAGSPGAKVATSFGVRVMVADSPTAPMRVFYSSPVTTTQVGGVSFAATGFLDVGVGGWPITFMDETRQRLTIANEGGEFWGLSGTPGVNDVLRRQPRGDLSPAQWYHTTRVGESIWFAPLGEDFPCEYTGSTVDKLRWRYLRFAGGSTPEMFVTSIPQQETVTFFEVGGSNRAAMLANDAWTFHTFGTTTRFATPMSVGGSGQDYDQPMVLTDGGSSTTPPTFYTYQPSLDRPGKTTDTFARPGDNSSTPLDAHFSTRYWWAPADKDVTVTEVTVDGFSWTDVATTNECTVQVRNLFRFGAVPYRDSTAYTEEWAAADYDDGADYRFRQSNPGAQQAQGFQIIVTGMVGFTVRRIRVQYTEEARR